MKIEDMNEGVRILLERMETHPQEFNNGILHKWSDVVGDVMQRARGEANPVPFLDDAEVQAIYDKLRDLERHEFTAKVLRKLADTPEEREHEQLDLPYIPAMPRRTYGLSVEEIKQAISLGVTPEVFAQSKQVLIEKQRQAYRASKKK
jgi:hypothetical protein